MTDSNADVLPLRVLVPESTAEPVVIYDQHAALRFAVVERTWVSRLGPEWDQPGNYVLLDAHDAEGVFGTYVGKAAPGGVRTRLMEHLNKKDHWIRAVVIQRDTTHGFDSAQVGWLEGRLYDLMQAAEFATLHNRQRPHDETLPIFERNMLEQAILPITRLLRLLGYDPASPGDKTTLRGRTTQGKRYFGVKLQDLIDAGRLTVGTRLVSVNGAWPATSTVTADGLEYDGRTFTSPSAAGDAVTGGSVPGWDFWAIETDTGRTTLATIRARYLADREGDASRA